MAIILPSGFIITSTDPIDSRITLPNSGSRYALAPANIYPGLTVYQQDVQTTYVLINTGSVSNSSGWQALATRASNQFSGSQGITGSLSVGVASGSAFDVNADTLTFTGSMFVTGGIYFQGLNSASANYVVGYDPTTGYLTYGSGGGGGGTTTVIGYQISTGSISASVNIDTASLFLIQSQSVPFFNIASNSDTTVYSDLFIIKSFTSQQPVLTVSNDILNIATHSFDPTGSTIAGNIYFTSGAMYVGLE